MRNKRGQGLSTNAIILIVLGVVVLAVLAIGFTAGWDKIAPWIGGDNVDEIAQQCSIACTTQSKYDFCEKQVTIDDGTNKVSSNCNTLATDNRHEKYGVETCPGLC